MRHAKIFSILVFATAALYGMVGFYFLPLAGFQSDLTRMGMLPESLFGWTREQPAIAPELMLQSSLQEADVLVIGDSFSYPKIWQTVLTRHGLRVHTESWENIRDICEDFSPWLHAQGFKGKYVVIEAIERNVPASVAHSVGCKKMLVRNGRIADTPWGPPPVIFDHGKKDFSGRLSVGIKTRINMIRYAHLSEQPDFKSWADGSIKVVRLAQGCAWFSHSSCKDALFLGEDSERDLAAEVIRNVETLNARFIGLTPVWAIVPNKSTAYLYPDKAFWNTLAPRIRFANLLKILRQAIEDKTIDVYPANNTHLSTTGYLLMGEEIYRNLQREPSGNANDQAAH